MSSRDPSLRHSRHDDHSEMKFLSNLVSFFPLNLFNLTRSLQICECRIDSSLEFIIHEHGISTISVLKKFFFMK